MGIFLAFESREALSSMKWTRFFGRSCGEVARGAENRTGDILSRAIASTVNLAEVQSKLVKVKHGPNAAWEAAVETVNAAEQVWRNLEVVGAIHLIR